ncbi:MAG TPA: hydroxymethylglutaryl-CoA synthase [Lentisphaeria bacterium]|nr:hydroxymethylglutaryl-CoA synthase [Lentisphaeria bacterium]
MNIGIEALSFYVPRYYLDLAALAAARGVDVDKYYIGLGQEKMAVPPPDEDVITMAANAGMQVLTHVDRNSIDTIMFATESGVDQSKAGAIFVHSLLDLPSTCRAFEIKQACCSSTAALDMAVALVHRHPDKKILIVAADVARYGFCTPGEPTQGAGAVAMVISSSPRLMQLDNESGSYTEDVMDFWRPNYMDEAVVDGKLSIRTYLHALGESWQGYHRQSGRGLDDFERFCYHLPFTRMGEKAHAHLLAIVAATEDCAVSSELICRVNDSLHYNRQIGNTYTASLYISLSSMLEHADDLSGQRIGLFSYGSGCMASFFSGIVSNRYQEWLTGDLHRDMLGDRVELSYEAYAELYAQSGPVTGDCQTPVHDTGRFRLAGITGHKRLYERVAASAAVREEPEPVA